MEKTQRIECPNCRYVPGKFCSVCDGRGYTEIPVDSFAELYNRMFGQSRQQSRDLTYKTNDPEGEKRRLGALNTAMNAYQMACCGIRSDGMSWEDIVPLASRMERFVKGEGFSPHEE